MNISTALPPIPVTSTPPAESMIRDNAERPLVKEPSKSDQSSNKADTQADKKGDEKKATDKVSKDVTERAEKNQQKLSEEEIEKLDELKRRNQEVRVHEQAHAAVGGKYAGSPSYEYERGPDGGSYAVAGAVQIDVSPVNGDPQATIQKMQVVRRAALAPAQPSAADRAIAADAANKATQARAELAKQQMQGEGDSEAKSPDISINAPFNKSLEEGGESKSAVSDSAPAEQGKKTLSSPDRGEMIASFYDKRVRPSVDSFSATA
ncbi:putative metalloprotease CJM1_0395 family protein [Idiomarina sp. HP20-50]|uniref:putative metalloprotease CJM1_0395 family protein n=1 Tax=Idiomarina sp. HP20-50 TaxID=3070813 RepID=UPI00294AB987|nr:putative metalloprotease CJM1_0395 family protein [Idiomarina sp. HP20-50]MDV6317259.1 putative metalloprotease CJM1_0395 family protein [Idiomarina sp. HP20-50]